MTTRQRLTEAATAGGWSSLERPYSAVYYRGGLVVAADFDGADDVLAGWWSYTAPGLGQLAFLTAAEPLAKTLLGWLGNPDALIDSALGAVTAAEEPAARLTAARAVLEAFAHYDPCAVIEVAALGRSLLHVISPEDYPEPIEMPLPRLDRSVGAQ